MGVKVRQKGDKWYVFINHQGQRKAKCIGSDKRVAVQVQKQLEAKLALGDVGLLEEAPEAILFGDYAEQWLDTYVTVACKPSTGRIVRSIVRNHLLPAFGTLDLRSMTRTHVKTFVAQKHQSLSAGHVRNLVRTLHKRVCAMAGLRVTRVHDLRHSYATIQLYELHAPIQYVSEQLGHASIKITIDSYGHPRQGTNTYLADRLDRGGELTHHSATQAQPDRNMVA